MYRGVAYSEGRIFFNTLDNHTIALDAPTGQEIWNTKVGEINMGESMTMASLGPTSVPTTSRTRARISA